MSSMQVDTWERGFSYAYDAPLDMRMGPEQELTARDIVNEWDERRLARVLREYGEERYANRIARGIVRARAREDLVSTQQLVEVIKSAVPVPAQFAGGHPARRTFQALRIAVNDELLQLDAALPAVWKVLRTGGRFAAISFHSLEDRRVKRFLAERARGCICPPELPICVCGHHPGRGAPEPARDRADTGRDRGQPEVEVGSSAGGSQARGRRRMRPGALTQAARSTAPARTAATGREAAAARSAAPPRNSGAPARKAAPGRAAASPRSAAASAAPRRGDCPWRRRDRRAPRIACTARLAPAKTHLGAAPLGCGLEPPAPHASGEPFGRGRRRGRASASDRPAAEPRSGCRSRARYVRRSRRPASEVASARFALSLPDHPLLDRVVRGRAWIPLLGVLLAGIVAAQVEILKLGASMGRSLEQTTALTSQNEQLQGSVASLSDDQRIERLASSMGMVLPPPGAVGYLTAKRGGSVGARARERPHAGLGDVPRAHAFERRDRDRSRDVDAADVELWGAGAGRHARERHPDEHAEPDRNGPVGELHDPERHRHGDHKPALRPPPRPAPPAPPAPPRRLRLRRPSSRAPRPPPRAGRRRRRRPTRRRRQRLRRRRRPARRSRQRAPPRSSPPTPPRRAPGASAEWQSSTAASGSSSSSS